MGQTWGLTLDPVNIIQAATSLTLSCPELTAPHGEETAGRRRKQVKMQADIRAKQPHTKGLLEPPELEIQGRIPH